MDLIRILRVPPAARRFRPLLLAFLLANLSATLVAEDESLDVDVRSVILTPKPKGRASDAAPNPALRVFRIRTPEEIQGPEKLVRPIDPDTALLMLNRLGIELETSGFRHAGPSEEPGILVSLEYGRGYLVNPYLDNRNTLASGNGASMLLPDIRTLEPGVAARTSDAGYEKLFLIVSAWDYQEFKQHQKGRRLWTTTISVDDPDHRDLTRLYKSMLAVGGAYFDRPTKEEAARVSVPVTPEGKVKVGTPTVVHGGSR